MNIQAIINKMGGHVVIACDTESYGPHTLTVQFATRIADEIVVQVYTSPDIPPQPDGAVLARCFPPGIRRKAKRVTIRPARRLLADLSPVRVLAELFHLRGIEPVERGGIDPKCDLSDPLTLTLVGHFWPADFFRAFGRDFFASLLKYQVRGGNLTIQAHRSLSFKEVGRRQFTDPILEYACRGEHIHPIKVKYFDTLRPFGSGSLDSLAEQYLGVRKLELTDDAKKNMLATFKNQTELAYSYAVLDPVLTLLVHEKMGDIDAGMYESLGLADIKPALRATQGSRVAEMTVRATAKAATESKHLTHKDTISLPKIRALLKEGSADVYSSEYRSEFREQTGHTHGGLLFSRSPTVLFHAADVRGLWRDVDLSGCYGNILRHTRLYVGRPVVHEPGTGGMKLKDAVEFLARHAADWDAWIVKVTGPITKAPNVLIPSTKNALTNANYRCREAKRRAAMGRYGYTAEQIDDGAKDTGNTAIYTDVIEAGIVAWPTWLMIGGFPQEVRAEYEALEVDSIIFYPRVLVADSGEAFDSLVEKYRHDGTPWNATIDMGELCQTIRRRIGSEYVTLRFGLDKLADKFHDLRQKAKKEHGKGSAAEKAYKLQINTLYGTFASPNLPTNNVVCANVVTATGRALAFAMQMRLNGAQVITDGCIYRRDQIPAGTFAECLSASNEYPINRAGFDGPFINPVDVPEGNKEFTAWYRDDLKRFFNVSRPDYDFLFGIHDLEHKACPDDGPEVAFDGLYCDGSANYIKLLRDGDGWTVAGGMKDGFKARSFREKSKQALADYLLPASVQDSYTEPPPITESSDLLSYDDAMKTARKALEELDVVQRRREDDPALKVYFPLGLDLRRVTVYKIVKLSAFLFRTPRQQEAWVRAVNKFAEATSCGLELLALRESCRDRRKGSIADIARAVYKIIRKGATNPTRALNLNRSFEERDRVEAGHHQKVQELKNELLTTFIAQIYAAEMTKAASLTGLFVAHEDITRFT